MAPWNAVKWCGAGLLTVVLGGCVIAPVEPVSIDISSRKPVPAPVVVSTPDPGYYGQAVYYWPEQTAVYGPTSQGTTVVQPAAQPWGYPIEPGMVAGFPVYNGYYTYPPHWAPVPVEPAR